MKETLSKHCCRIGLVKTEEDEVGNIYIRIGDQQYRVDFCPICGKKSAHPLGERFCIYSNEPRRDCGEDFFNMDGLHTIPIPGVIDSIDLLKEEWVLRIKELNENIESIRNFMLNQNCHNECFLSQQLENSIRISRLERKNETI